MTKLKTLKDIFKPWDDKKEFKEASYNCGCGSCDEGCFESCDVVKIKDEAVKWVKNGDRKLIQLIPSAINYQECVCGIKTSQKTFKTFFNITEEDLK